MNSNSEKYVVFQLGNEHYALSTHYAFRIEKGRKIRPIPKVNQDIVGIVTLEEDIVPLVDLRTHFKIQRKYPAEQSPVIICKDKDHDLTVGFIVDAVLTVRDIPNAFELGNIGEHLGGDSTRYIQAIYRPPSESDEKSNEDGEELLIILNARQLLKLEHPEDVADIQDSMTE